MGILKHTKTDFNSFNEANPDDLNQSFECFDDDDDKKEDKLMRLFSIVKFTFIMSSYSFAFIIMVKFGMWLYDLSSYDSAPQKELFIYDWFQRWMNNGSWNNDHIKSILINFALLILFGLQHSLMKGDILYKTIYWSKFHHELKMDKSIYVFATGLSLLTLMYFWRSSNLYCWYIDALFGQEIIIKSVHIFAWALFYGTSLMLDLPDLIGLNQVVITSPNVIKKSPNLQIMYKSQRHMGFITFAVILLFFPVMSLDRFVLTLTIVAYSFFCWRTTGSYAYAKSMKDKRF